MLRVCVMLSVIYPLNPPCVRSLRWCGTVVLVLFGPSCLGRFWPLHTRSPWDKCSVRCRPIKRETKFTATFDQNLPSIKYIFAFSSEIYRQSYLWDNLWRNEFLKTYSRTLIAVVLVRQRCVTRCNTTLRCLFPYIFSSDSYVGKHTHIFR